MFKSKLLKSLNLKNRNKLKNNKTIITAIKSRNMLKRYKNQKLKFKYQNLRKLRLINKALNLGSKKMLKTFLVDLDCE